MEWTGTPSILGPSRVQLALVTLSIAGLQFAWGIEQVYVNIYLLDLGMAATTISIIWLAGPICGLLCQPAAGTWSDYCTSRYGRRRPYIIVSALFIVFGLQLFAFSVNSPCPKTMAVFGILLVNISLNVCQACCRSLIVDLLPRPMQKQANGWAARMSSGGHLFSYILCSLDLSYAKISQPQIVCIVSSVILFVCVIITCGTCRERTLVSYENPSRTLPFAELWEAAVTLGEPMRSIFSVQMLAYYAWFTWLFYASTWTGQVWRKTNKDADVGDIARAGSLTLVCFSLSATVFAAILPLFSNKMVMLWSVSCGVYAFAILFTGFVGNYHLCQAIGVVVGFVWAMAQWAPFALTAQAIHDLPRTRISHDDCPEIARLTVEETPRETELASENYAEKSGVYLGLHNCAVTLPQFLSTFGSFVVFSLFENPSNSSATALTLQIGALPMLLAARYAIRLQ